MAKQRKLGFYWGESEISLVEVNRDNPSAVALITLQSLLNDPLVGVKSILEDARLLDLIQTAFRNGRFSTVDTSLSLPSKDCIIRWFVIPWMKPSEIQAVVAFEAKKYLPFPIDELVYTYHPMTFSKGGVRQIGIVFMAVRKNILGGYLNVLRQAGLNAIYIEPGAVSIARALIFKKIIDPIKTAAILSFTPEGGEIVITTQGQVRFIRDFKISESDQTGSDEQRSAFRSRLYNEVRMSLDYFSRLQTEIDVSAIIALSSELNKDIWDGLRDDIGLPVRFVDVMSILQKTGTANAVHLYGYGAGLAGNVSVVADMNLMEGLADVRADQQKVKDIRKSWAPDRLRMSFFAGCALAGLIFLGVWSSTNALVMSRQAVYAEIAEKIGAFVDVPREEIEAKKQAELAKSAALRSLSFRSEVAPFTIRLIKALPEGVWFDKLAMSSSEEGASAQGAALTPGSYYPVKVKRTLTISAFVYTGDHADEILAANRFVENIKADPQFATWFASVNLGELKILDRTDYKVTSFTVECR